MMRLPAPPAEEPVDGTSLAVPAPVPGPKLRVQAGLVGRLAHGSQDDVGLRTALAVMVRPSGRYGLRLGVIGELGSSADVESGNFRGEWSDWSVAGVASWSVPLGSVVVEPFAGGGIARLSLSGTDSMVSRDEAATVPLVRAGAMLRWQLAWWSVGAMASVDALLSTPAYTRANMGMGVGTQELFEGPSVAVSVGVMAAIDFGR